MMIVTLQTLVVIVVIEVIAKWDKGLQLWSLLVGKNYEDIVNYCGIILDRHEKINFFKIVESKEVIEGKPVAIYIKIVTNRKEYENVVQYSNQVEDDIEKLRESSTANIRIT